MKPKQQEKTKNATYQPTQGHWQQMNRKQRREMTRKIQSEDISLEMIHPDAAGIDIGDESHYVAVPPRRDSQPVRRFGCTTAELKAMADWLKQCGIRTVAMQSTGVYWIAVYDILEQAVRLERSTAGRHARNRCPMASRRIPLVLDGDFETQEAHRQKTHIAGGSGSELPNGRRESHLGCTTGNPDRESSGRWSNCGSACVSCSNIRERELRYVTPVRG